MKRDSVNETCYTCHMEKRGPFVHVHEPVAEDCSNCHNPHGTVAENLLKARPPFLCHQCHTPHGGQVAQLRGQGQTDELLLTKMIDAFSGYTEYATRVIDDRRGCPRIRQRQALPFQGTRGRNGASNLQKHSAFGHSRPSYAFT